MNAHSVSVAALLEGRQVVICAGSGGVGKTTVAAAVAVGMAARGARVAVLTIDPARRLAGSLGLDELGNEARRVEPERFAAAGLEMRGELWAMMLDAKRTFDELVERRAPDRHTRDAILANRIYQELSNAVAGSQEYMAMEKLYELHHEGDYDLLVLDTPPTRNALDFLDAPEHLSRFLDSRSLQFFLLPGRRGLGLLGRGTSLLFSALTRVTGVDLLRDLSEFFQAISGMVEGLRERAVRVDQLLADPRTTFLVVTSPRRDSIDEALYFRRRLRESRLPFGGVVVNRAHERAAGEDTAASGELARLVGDDLARKVARNQRDYRALVDGERQCMARLEPELDGAPVVTVPQLDDDVHDIAGLMRVDEHLFADALPERSSSGDGWDRRRPRPLAD